LTTKIALFGGSFDPFHLGHFLVARMAWECFSLNQVVFLPCAQSPLKSFQPLAPDAKRLDWLKSGLKGQGWAKVSPWEIDRRGISYSVETARHWKIKNPHAGLYWILGSDQWGQLPRWKNFSDLARLVHFLVFPRSEIPLKKPGVKMSVIPARFDISSTEIRMRLKKGLSIKGLVPCELEGQLKRSRFYR
jgi:nicotinate-nucleotide adenylyltransferase